MKEAAAEITKWIMKRLHPGFKGEIIIKFKKGKLFIRKQEEFEIEY